MSNSKHINRDYAKNSTVTKGFRKLLLELYPGLNKDASYRKFIAVLLFSEHLDKDTKEVIIPYDVIADIEGKESEYVNNNYNSENFLKRFQTEVMTPTTFTYSNYSKNDKKARTARVIWKDEIITALKLELPSRKNRTITKVLISTGESYTAKKRKKDFEMQRSEAFHLICKMEPAAKELLDYLKSRSHNIYTVKFNENIDTVIAEVEKIQDCNSRNYHERILKNMCDNHTTPIYRPSRKGMTDRIFTGSWMLLKRKYRELLTKGWNYYDLKYSQVAICAALWDIEVVKTFLASGGHIWRELFSYLGFNHDNLKSTDRDTFDEIKSVLKDELYALLFGKWKSAIERDLETGLVEFNCAKSPKELLNNYIMQALYNAREKKKKQIIRRGYIDTCFGRKLTLKYESPRKNNVKRLMALQAQALELQVLLPVVRLAKDTDEFQIVLWGHDGFYVAYKDMQREHTWSGRIKQIVLSETQKWNVLTELEGE